MRHRRLGQPALDGRAGTARCAPGVRHVRNRGGGAEVGLKVVGVKAKVPQPGIRQRRHRARRATKHAAAAEVEEKRGKPERRGYSKIEAEKLQELEVQVRDLQLYMEKS